MTEEQIEKLIERLVQRIQLANEYFLKNIGSSIAKIKELTPSQAHQLIQMLKYGDNYDRIIKEISKYTNMDIKDIDEMFKIYAKQDYNFAEKFYKYRNIPFVEYEKNIALRNQTEAFSRIVKNEMYNYFRSNVLGYTIHDILPNGKKGKVVFYGLRETYNRVLDEALLNISQGKETFDASMSRVLSDLGGSGLKMVDYTSGRSVRLDSVVRMHLKSRLNELHNENQKLIGEQFGADGIEITVHAFPAEDHAPVQGRQFSKEQYALLDSGLKAKDVKGNEYTLDHDGKGGYRPISEMNCYHKTIEIVLGVSKPMYTDEQLQKINTQNAKGFEYEGKHYTLYEGTQLQRQIETEIRKQKDTQILAKESNNQELAIKSQKKINILTNKYQELSEISGIPTKMERLKVNKYRPIKL